MSSQPATKEAGISPEVLESSGDKPVSSNDEGIEDDVDPGDEPEKQLPLAGMRVRDLRKLLDEPDNPLYPEAVKSAQPGIDPSIWAAVAPDTSKLLANITGGPREPEDALRFPRLAMLGRT